MKKILRLFFLILVNFVILISLAQASKVDKNISLIPAGDFFMGTEEGTKVERPVHKVFLRETPSIYTEYYGPEEKLL